MKIKTLINLILLSPLFLFTGCGEDKSTKESTENSNIVTIVFCTTPRLSNYTEIVNGDVLVKDSNPTKVEIIHNSINDKKKVCVLNGSAHLVR